MIHNSCERFSRGSVLSVLMACALFVGFAYGENSEELLNEGVLLYREGRYVEAAEVFGEAAAQDPPSDLATSWQTISSVRAEQLPLAEAIRSTAAVLQALETAQLRSELGTEVMDLSRELSQRSHADDTEIPEQTAEGDGIDRLQEEKEDLPYTEVIQVRASHTKIFEAEGTENPNTAIKLSEDEVSENGNTAIQNGDIVEIESVSRPPKALRMSSPRYPDIARQRRVRGEYRARMLIGVDGKVEQIRVISIPQPGLGFEESVEDAAASWLFGPAVIDGVPVRVWMLIRIPFGG